MTKNFDCSDTYVASLADLLRTPDWMADGDCVDEDPRLWDDLIDDDEPNPVAIDPAVRAANRARAAAICGECPVREMCAAWASLNEVSGLWGGVEQEVRDAKRGGKTFKTMEERREDVEWRTDVASLKPAAELADKWGVSERTIYRWRAEQGEQNEQAA